MSTVAWPDEETVTADPTIERWNVQARTGRRPAKEWAEVLAATHVAFEIRLTDRMPDVFKGVVTRRRLGELALVDCTCTPFVGRGGTAIIGEPMGDIVGLQWVRQGTERVGRVDPLTLTRGATIVWDGAKSADVEVAEPFAKRTLILPRGRVLAHCPQFYDVGTIKLQERNGAARLLASYLEALIAELPMLQGRAVEVVADTIVELACSAIEPGLPSSRTARRVAIRAAIRRFIRENLRDPHLGPQGIAHAHTMSVRTLHALFEETGESVAALIRRERLDHAMNDLRRIDGGSVTEIAFRWGFQDSAHFSRAFKKQFGLTPRDARRAEPGI